VPPAAPWTAWLPPARARPRWWTWWEPPKPAPAAIDHGTAVRLSLTGSRSRRRMLEEGVVIEVVPPWALARSERVVPASPVRSSVVRYVVQCWGCRLIRRASELVVVSL
jgi:hypothetical protein